MVKQECRNAKAGNPRQAEIIRKRREELHMTRQELADELDVCLQTIYRYESEGVDIALLQKYRKLSEKLQLPITTLLGDEE